MHVVNKQEYLPRFANMIDAATTGVPTYVMGGDLGGTKTNLALFNIANGQLQMIDTETYRSREYAAIGDILKLFLSRQPDKTPERICIGVAGPVIDGKVDLTNLALDLSEEEVKHATGVKNVKLINDLEATAYGLGTLTPDQLVTLHRGNVRHKGNMAIIAPGTGLGEAGIFWNGSAYLPFATEGGHCDFAPRTDLDIELLQYFQEKYEIVSWERLLSGPGIMDIYIFLRDEKNMLEPDWLAQTMRENDPAAVISTNALEEKLSICIKTMELFVRYLARESANLVLKMKATGGLFLGGGIPPKIAPLLQNNDFYHHYLQSDRLVELLTGVPIHLINNDKTALWGAAYYAAFAAADQ
ncbi:MULTISPECIES: glucokinase [Chitinophaga]|uniref:glucokinase n=1 Tax=Chitinophaga TaxID=79328 RepID=UPI001CEC8E64|nr:MULTISPECIES: glucokinase [Chitinophaga]